MTDLGGATRLFTELLDGQPVTTAGWQSASAAELTWSNGARLRLVGPAADEPGPTTPPDSRTHLHFTRRDSPFSPAELSRAADLARRLGTSLHLTGN